MNVYIPESLQNVDDSTKYLLHVICSKLAVYDLEPDGYVPLKAEYLHAVLGNGYKKVIERAIESGLIDCDGQYIVGQKSKGYRLASKYQWANRIFRPIKDKSLIKRSRGFQKKRGDLARATINGTSYKQCKADLTTVTIDDVDWAKFESTLRQNKSLSNRERVENAKYKMRQIRERNWFCKKCDYGRLHTNITQLNNQLIENIRLENQRVTSIDIINSQTIFLHEYVRRHVWEHYDYDKSNPSFINPSEQAIYDELERFQKLVSKGVIYDTGVLPKSSSSCYESTQRLLPRERNL